MEQYKTVLEGGTGEIVEKKSRFIATVRPVKNEEEALAFLEEMRKKYWDARHNCYAYSIGKNREFTRCSDDGEPSGTAGRPMLDVILGEDIYNVAVVVTRYFGGVLLGTGGLVRAGRTCRKPCDREEKRHFSQGYNRLHRNWQDPVHRRRTSDPDPRQRIYGQSYSETSCS